jgi:hypothetical protein
VIRMCSVRRCSGRYADSTPWRPVSTPGSGRWSYQQGGPAQEARFSESLPRI